jgi:hypothetical protein
LASKFDIKKYIAAQLLTVENVPYDEIRRLYNNPKSTELDYFKVMIKAAESGEKTMNSKVALVKLRGGNNSFSVKEQEIIQETFAKSQLVRITSRDKASKLLNTRYNQRLAQLKKRIKKDSMNIEKISNRTLSVSVAISMPTPKEFEQMGIKEKFEAMDIINKAYGTLKNKEEYKKLIAESIVPFVDPSPDDASLDFE